MAPFDMNQQKTRFPRHIGGLDVTVHAQIYDLKADWLRLEQTGYATYYQSYAWCQAWLESVAERSSVTVAVICGRDLSGAACFIIPLQISQRFGVGFLQWLSAGEANYCFGIFDRRADAAYWPDWFDAHVSQILALVENYDVVCFYNMPKRLFGFDNPLGSLGRFASANQSFITHLTHDYDALLQHKRSPKSIGKMRRRDTRLEELGPLEFQVLAGGESAEIALQEALRDKQYQLAQIGVHSFATEQVQDYFGRLLKQPVEGLDRLYVFRLLQNGKTISSSVGAVKAGCFWLLILSMAPDAPLQFSPGDYLLRKIIAWSCANNIAHFDFSIGHSNYKQLWMDEEVELRDHFGARTLKGLPIAAAFLFYHTFKRMIKNQPAIKSAFFAIRKFFAGHKVK